MDKKSLCGLTADEIFNIIRPSGFKFSHALSISNSIYKNRTNDISEIPKIPKKLRNELDTSACSGTFLPVSSETSADRTIKYLFRADIGKEYETVYIPENKRITVCVSTQSGCRMGCLFCATATYGFRGNLSVGEIVNQYPGCRKSYPCCTYGNGRTTR
jgi:23S rRNA (adenine2503-C2)-methyltransferase